MSVPIPPQEQAAGQPAPDAEAREFAVAFRRCIEWAHRLAAEEENRNEGSALALDFLGPHGAAHSVVTRDLAAFEHVNLQTAVNAWSAIPGRTAEAHGIAMPPHYGGLSLQQLISADGLPPVRLSAPALVDLPNGPGSTLGCLRRARLQAGRTAEQGGRCGHEQRPARQPRSWTQVARWRALFLFHESSCQWIPTRRDDVLSRKTARLVPALRACSPKVWRRRMRRRKYGNKTDGKADRKNTQGAAGDLPPLNAARTAARYRRA